jgi:transglutaminase-like putative cysteine protease
MKRPALLLLALILVPQIFSMVAETSGAAVEAEGSSFRIRYTATLVNIDSRMDRVVVYLPIPREWDSQKAVQIEEIDPKPTSLNEDSDYGNKMAYFLLPNGIPGNQSREFTIQYTFTFYQTHVVVDPARITSYNKSDPMYVKYTRQNPSDWVESDDSIIRKAASDIVGSEANPYRKAKLIYDWMVTNIEYKFPSPWGAKQTYLKREGDCGSQTALFCAMAISQRIPCRAVSGLIFSSPFPRTYGSKGSPSEPAAYGSHAYAEFYLPIYGWIPADTSIGRGSGRPEEYFGHTWDFFSIRSKGFGIQMVPPIPERVWLFVHYAWWFWGNARKYDSYYTYIVEKMEIAQTTTATETTTSLFTSYTTSAWTPTSSVSTESAVTSATEKGYATIALPTQIAWLQAGWPYLALAVVVTAIAAIVLSRKGKRVSEWKKTQASCELL